MFNKIPFAIFILFLATVAVSAGATQHVKVVCENELLVVECPKGSTINIVKAVYGKQENKYCNSPGNNVSNCISEHSYPHVRNTCEHKQKCKILASSKIFGDPCKGTTKYLQVTYKCKSEKIVSKHACQFDKLHIKCPEGHTIKVANALYGRTHPDLCFRPQSSIQSNECSTKNATEVVESNCENLQECTLLAEDKFFFGDPCWGTYKYLEVDYQCLPSQKKVASEGEILELACPRGSYMQVLSATYGSRNKALCNTTGTNPYSIETHVVRAVERKCDSKQVCKIRTENKVFADPCVGTEKYLEVIYHCFKSSSIRTYIVCENSDLGLNCRNDSYIWVTNAFYGRKDATTCNKDNRRFKSNNCGSQTALDVLQAKCDNSKKCTIVAKNAAYGDPCVGTPKYLEADVICVYNKRPK